jgi:hypothetical protein
MLKPPIFLCAQIKNRGYGKTNTAVGKTGYKWKTAYLKSVVSKTEDGDGLLY